MPSTATSVILLGMIYVLTGSAEAHATTLNATINGGGAPCGIAHDFGKGENFVANKGSDSVSIISDSNDFVVSSIEVELPPRGSV